MLHIKKLCNIYINVKMDSANIICVIIDFGTPYLPFKIIIIIQSFSLVYIFIQCQSQNHSWFLFAHIMCTYKLIYIFSVYQVYFTSRSKRNLPCFLDFRNILINIIFVCLYTSYYKILWNEVIKALQLDEIKYWDHLKINYF